MKRTASDTIAVAWHYDPKLATIPKRQSCITCALFTAGKCKAATCPVRVRTMTKEG